MTSQHVHASRSWGGCSRCRKRRQKCDEQKPSCRRCETACTDCDYQTPLRWGGRSFASSRFGKVLKSNQSNGAQKLVLGDGSFVYTSPLTTSARSITPVSTNEGGKSIVVNSEEAKATVAARGAREWEVLHVEREPGKTQQAGGIREAERGEEAEAQAVELTERFEHSQRIIPYPRQLESLPFATSDERRLLHHFIHSASRATSCHSLVQQDVCRIILPMAVENPALLSATLVLSAIHQKSLDSPACAYAAERMITGLKTTSLRHLWNALQNPLQQDLNVILATIRTLCLAEVYDGGHRANSWRAHFNGARALIKQVSKRSRHVSHDGQSSTDFLRRWFSVTEGLVSLTPDSIPATDTVEAISEEASTVIGRKLTIDNTVDEDEESVLSYVYLDEYTGCSTDLSRLFREAGIAIKIHQTQHEVAIDRVCNHHECYDRALRLECQIRDMITRDQGGNVMFHPKATSVLSPRQVVEFALCNSAYQHSALLHIQRRLFDLSAAHEEVQETVGMIVDCVEGIAPAEGLSPLAVLTTPLFVAGCEAFGHDRVRVRRILDSMYSYLRIPNIRRASIMLEQYWSSAQHEPSLDWAKFAKLHRYDFLPY